MSERRASSKKQSNMSGRGRGRGRPRDVSHDRRALFGSVAKTPRPLTFKDMQTMSNTGIFEKGRESQTVSRGHTHAQPPGPGPRPGSQRGQ